MQPVWSRGQLWSVHDARHARRLRYRACALAAAVGTAWLGMTLASYACTELYIAEDDVRAPAIALPVPDPECVVDTDCVLMPSLVTCCGECEAAPPFEAAPREALVLLRRETDAACAPASRLCDPPLCATVARGCEARAVCSAGECRAIANARCEGR